MDKFILDKKLYGVNAYPSSGKIELNETTSQKDLKILFELKFKGITKIEVKEEVKKTTKKRAKK